MRPISVIECCVLLAWICGAAIGCDEGGGSGSYACQVGLFDCIYNQCCELPADRFVGSCRALDPAAPPFLSGYCESVCHVTADCVDGAVCLHPSPCDGDPLTKGVCTLVGDADPALVECPDERP
jgi:hypothetical protein